MSESKTLDSICSLIVDCPHSTPVWTDAGYVVLRNQNIKGGTLDLSNPSFTDEAHFKERNRRAKPSFGDIVITREAPMGEVCMIPEGLECCLGQRQVLLRPNRSVVSSRYVFYALQSEMVQHQISWNEGTGSTVSNIRIPVLKALSVPVPPLPEQRAIAHILGTLDDKIELNRKQNETLEAMARALFKAWFVDFEPVRAKLEGRWQRGQSLPGLPAHLYDLFPDRLVDSELGEIPEGWEMRTVGDDLVELVSGARPKGGAIDEGVPSVGAENVIGLGRYDFSKEKFVPLELFEQLRSKGADVRPGDVLLYKDGAQIGRKTFFDRGFPHPECAINEHVFILRCASSWLQRYLFFWLDLPWMTSEIVSLNSNSAQPGINQAGVRQLPLLRPTDEVVATFDRLVAPLTDVLFERCLESSTFSALRDALLPKLISGELRVKDAERFVADISPNATGVPA